MNTWVPVPRYRLGPVFLLYLACGHTRTQPVIRSTNGSGLVYTVQICDDCGRPTIVNTAFELPASWWWWK